MSQDIHFSQYYMSPLSLNPSLTGDYDGDWRVMYNFRRQWQALGYPYGTTSFAFDKQFYVYNEKISAGIIYINDKSGPASLTSDRISISGAYHKAVGTQQISGGLQVGYISKGIKPSSLTFPNQFDNETGYFNPAMGSGQAQIGENMNYIDANLGGAWNMAVSERLKPFANFALFHINSPKESFRNSDNRLKPRSLLNIGAKVHTKGSFYFVPSLMMMGHTKAAEILPGIIAGYDLKENKAGAKQIYLLTLFRSGVTRNTDAFAIGGGMNFKRLQAGISYDINISDLHVYTGYRGAFEIALIYTELSSRPKKIVIPCDRY